MAPKQQGKKIVKTGKKKQPQKNNRQAKQRKLQPLKQKKTWSRHDHRAKAVNAGRLKNSSSKLFASRILRQMPKVRMAAKARHLVRTMLTRLYKQVATEVKKLEKKNEPSDVSSAEIKTVLNDAMTKLLSKYAPKPVDATVATTSNQCS